jgi:hypothetical protein
MQQLETDILIVGGGLGGVACAIAAASAGRRVIVVEETKWIGGQLTSQMTPPDEHGWIEHVGATRSYREMRERVRDFYRKNYPLTEIANSNRFLNPGNGWVSPLCAEPKVFLKVITSMIEPFVSEGRIQIIHSAVAIGVRREGRELEEVLVRQLACGEELSVKAKYFVDATETGELLPLADVEFVSGAESQAETGETSAKAIKESSNSQAFSVCFAVSHHLGKDFTVDEPADFEFWRDFIPTLNPPWSGRLLSLTGINPRTLEPVTYSFNPNTEPYKAFAGLWSYRRILHTDNFEQDFLDSDVTVINVPQIDYFLDDLAGVETREQRASIIERAKGLSLSFLYFLQTECGLRGLKLRGDISGTSDGLAMAPYVRESRRIKAEYTITEGDVAATTNPGEKFGARYSDSIGVGSYRIDLHPSVGGDNYIDVEALPFQIPLGALIPRDVDNLLPACKNIGTTHITNGCYRLHPVEWNIGEVVGYLAAFCLERGVRPRDVRSDRVRCDEFIKHISKAGVETEWPDDLDLAGGDPHRHAK